MRLHSTLLQNEINGPAMIRSLIRKGDITIAGNRKLMIYGLLNCHSGKRMKTGNRVFFANEEEAARQGYRPCGHCCKAAYRQWKDGQQKKRE